MSDITFDDFEILAEIKKSIKEISKRNISTFSKSKVKAKLVKVISVKLFL